MGKLKLPTMTKKAHWGALGIIYIVCFVLAFISFMTVPMLGLLFVAAPAVATIAAVIIYLKNAR